MKRIYFFFAIIYLSQNYVFGQTLNVSSIQTELEGSKVLNDYFYGFCLYDLDSNRFLLGVNQEKHFAPASNTKVFTLITALTALGDSIPGIHYIEKGDSLIFWGTGDPTFLHNRLDTKKVFNFLKESERKLYFLAIDDTQEPFYRNGWSIEDYNEYYQPEISTFPIYGNVVTFKGDNGKLIAVPELFQKNVSFHSDTTQKFVLKRNYSTNEFSYNKNIVPGNYLTEKPFRYSSELAVELLQDTLNREIKVITGKVPNTGFKTVYSVPTVDILREMMLPSDNFLAEQFQMMAAQAIYGSFQTESLRMHLSEQYFNKFADKIQLHDGSGLSTYNKVTPRSMVEALILVNGLTKDRNQLEYLFPTGGVNGTLKRAYQLDQGQPFVWAKTGTINGVHNQSGYIRTRSGRNLVFSFMNTNYLGSATPIRKEMVRVITYIRQNY